MQINERAIKWKNEAEWWTRLHFTFTPARTWSVTQSYVTVIYGLSIFLRTIFFFGETERRDADWLAEKYSWYFSLDWLNYHDIMAIHTIQSNVCYVPATETIIHVRITFFLRWINTQRLSASMIRDFTIVAYPNTTSVYSTISSSFNHHSKESAVLLLFECPL